MRRRSGKSRDLASGIETTVFRSSNSDAVRLPKGLALSGQRVRIRRLDDGRVVIEPVRRRRWPPGFLDAFGRVTAGDTSRRPQTRAMTDRFVLDTDGVVDVLRGGQEVITRLAAVSPETSR